MSRLVDRTPLVRVVGFIVGMTLFIGAIVLMVAAEANLTPAASLEIKQTQLIQQARAAWVAGDAAAFAALFTADGELIVPGQRWQGPIAIEMESARFLAQQKVEIEIQAIIVENNQAAVAWNWRETSKTTGQVNLAEDAIWVEFVGGKIRLWREYIDLVTPTVRR